MQVRTKGGKNKYYSKEEKLKYVYQMLEGRSCWDIERAFDNKTLNLLSKKYPSLVK